MTFIIFSWAWQFDRKLRLIFYNKRIPSRKGLKRRLLVGSVTELLKVILAKALGKQLHDSTTQSKLLVKRRLGEALKNLLWVFNQDTHERFAGKQQKGS